ncbi:MAG TPA: hypothetical protein VGM96_17815 [Reyranella sp.]|jgi:hypothetical protein
MQAYLNFIQQIRNALGDIRCELQLIEAGIVVPKNKAEAVAYLLAREKMAATILGL